MEIISLIVVGLLIFFSILTAYKGVRVVPQGQVWTIERFGKFTGVIEPGLNILVPYVDQIGRKMNIQEVILDIPEQTVITKDNASVIVDGIVYYKIINPELAAYAVQNMELALASLAMTNLRSVIGSMELDNALSNRDQINKDILVTLDNATNPWGIKVTRVEVKKVEPPFDILKSMQAQMSAEREKRAMILIAEGQRESQIAKANGEKEAAVLSAQGRLESAELDARARERLAAAEAEAIKLISQAAGTNNEGAKYLLSKQNIEANVELFKNPKGNNLIIPMELSGMSTQLGGALALNNALDPNSRKQG